MSHTIIGNVGVRVADQERALEFYTKTLGFEVRRDVPFGDGRWIEVGPPGGQTTIALIKEDVPSGIRLFTEDAKAMHARLKASGADADDEIMDLGDVPPMFTVRDSEGNTLIIVGIGQGNE